MTGASGRIIAGLLCVAGVVPTSTDGGERDPSDAAVATSANAPDAEAKENLRSKLQTGRWKTVGFRSGDAKVEGAAASAALPAELQFGDGTLALVYQGERIANAAYAIDETVEPARMTIETTVPHESLPENRGRTVGFCIDGVCYSMPIESAPEKLFPKPKVKTIVSVRLVDDRLEMSSLSEPPEPSANESDAVEAPALSVIYERFDPKATLSPLGPGPWRSSSSASD